jgi:hypothetical protein
VAAERRESRRAAIDCGVARADGSDNLAPPLTLDARNPDWPIERADAVLSINMVHISPWAPRSACSTARRGCSGRARR